MKESHLGERNGIHISDLQKTLKMFRKPAACHRHLLAVKDRSFVGTKRQARKRSPKGEALRCILVNHRWLGGTLTNWATLQKSISA